MQLGIFISSTDKSLIKKTISDPTALSRYVSIRASFLEGDFPNFNYTSKNLTLVQCDKEQFSFPFPRAGYCIEKGQNIQL